MIQLCLVKISLNPIKTFREKVKQKVTVILSSVFNPYFIRAEFNYGLAQVTRPDIQ